jgi:hypothetical protein
MRSNSFHHSEIFEIVFHILHSTSSNSQNFLTVSQIAISKIKTYLNLHHLDAHRLSEKNKTQNIISNCESLYSGCASNARLTGSGDCGKHLAHGPLFTFKSFCYHGFHQSLFVRRLTRQPSGRSSSRPRTRFQQPGPEF